MNKITYIPRLEKIKYTEDQHANQIRKGGVSGIDVIDYFVSKMGNADDLSEYALRDLIKIEFDLERNLVSVYDKDGQESLYCDSNVDSKDDLIKKCFNDFFGYDDGIFKDIAEMSVEQDEPDEIETKTVLVDYIRYMDGTPYLDKIEKEVPVTDSKEVVDLLTGKGTGRFIDVPRVKKGKKVEKSKRDKLKSLEEKKKLILKPKKS